LDLDSVAYSREVGWGGEVGLTTVILDLAGNPSDNNSKNKKRETGFSWRVW